MPSPAAKPCSLATHCLALCLPACRAALSAGSYATWNRPKHTLMMWRTLMRSAACARIPTPACGRTTRVRCCG